MPHLPRRPRDRRLAHQAPPVRGRCPRQRRRRRPRPLPLHGRAAHLDDAEAPVPLRRRRRRAHRRRHQRGRLVWAPRRCRPRGRGWVASLDTRGIVVKGGGVDGGLAIAERALAGAVAGEDAAEEEPREER